MRVLWHKTRQLTTNKSKEVIVVTVDMLENEGQF